MSQLRQSKYVLLTMDYLEDELILANCLGENPEWKERKERRFSQEDNKGGFFISCNDLICTRVFR